MKQVIEAMKKLENTNGCAEWFEGELFLMVGGKEVGKEKTPDMPERGLYLADGTPTDKTVSDLMDSNTPFIFVNKPDDGQVTIAFKNNRTA